MPDTVDPDELFKQIVEGIEITEPDDVQDYTQLSDVELSLEHSRVRMALYELPGNEMHNPNPVGEAAGLRAQFAAINFEMRRRWGETD